MTCTSCGGTGGHVEDTSSEGVARQNWVSCPTCHGTGTH